MNVGMLAGRPGQRSEERLVRQVALDGSEESLEVVAPAAELASALKASVVLVHAGKRPPPSITLAQKLLVEHKVPFRTLLLKGEAAEAILKAVEEEKADLLALTTTGKTKRDQILFGSVAEESQTYHG